MREGRGEGDTVPLSPYGGTSSALRCTLARDSTDTE